MKKINLLSNAKINLGLYIIDKRKDGFHNIRTLFLPISLYDKITIEENEDIIIKTDKKDVPCDERNTVFKAAQLLKEKFDLKKGCLINIKKNIPIGAGLGGGSSNAAFSLVGLNRLWDLNLNEKILMELALKIGSDVPFFILNRPALGEGRGEILTEIKVRCKFRIIIVYPDISIDTENIYRKYKINLTKNKKNVIFSFKTKGLNSLNQAKRLENELETIVIKEYPHIQKIKDQLYNDGAVFSSVSGSGSSVFGLFDEKDFFESIEEKYKDFGKVFVVSPINI